MFVVAGAAMCVVASWPNLRRRLRRRHDIFRDAVAPTAAARAAIPEGHRVIAVIGIDSYTAWPDLHNAAGDARGVLELFRRRGFAPARRRDGSELGPLLDAAATDEAIRGLISQLGKLTAPIA
jgi:hypothetical protein